MEEGKRSRNGGKQEEDELRLGHREHEVPRDMPNSPVEECPAWREKRVECHRLQGQDHKG